MENILFDYFYVQNPIFIINIVCQKHSGIEVKSDDYFETVK